MASNLKNLSERNDLSLPQAEEMHFGIVVSDYHHDITDALYEGCINLLRQQGAKAENIHTLVVPGAFELVAGAAILAKQHPALNAVICLGCVIKGETPHNDYINQAVANGLAQLSITWNKAFIFGLLTPNDHQQALDRAGGKHGNKGEEAAAAALRMAYLLYRTI